MTPLRTDSLALRLFIAAAVWSTLALLAAALVIIALYRQSVERGFDERLDVYIKTIVAALVDAGDRPATLGENSFGEPRFGLPLSGWYWQIKRADGAAIAASGSLFDTALPLPSELGYEADENRARRAYLKGPDAQELRVLEREITVGDKAYSVAVAGNADDVAADIRSFRNNVALTLGVFGIGLLATVLFQVRFGLRPLDRIRRALSDIRMGTAERLEGRFAAEIEPLVIELNALLKSNQEIVERARTHVGNLAHALKTPLSVIVNEARNSSDTFTSRKVEEQANLMRDQVQHYLDRARMAARANVIGTRTPVRPVIEALARAMARIYGDRGIAVSLGTVAAADFRGERQDLEEMVGNLLDNACKWAAAAVTITVSVLDAGADRRIRILIEDDGPGLSPEQRSEAVRRGKRLDETKPGSGLGLSIVTELAELYRGTFQLGEATAGGLRAELVLPAV